MITDEYLKLNQELHATHRGWGKGGVQWLDQILEQTEEETTVLDYGCGKGALVHKLWDLGRTAVGYDPAVEDFDFPGVLDCDYDLLVCTDVMEHVEPEFVDETIAKLASLSPRAFIVICTVSAKKLLPDGSNAHRTVMPREWWMGELLRHYSVVKCTGSEDSVTPQFECLV